MESKPLSRQLGANVRRLRKERGLSLAEVSACMADLGVPLTLNGLSKVELGNRGLDLDELVALARALRVPPLLLIFPLGRDRTVEVLPGYVLDTWWAAQSFTGETPFMERNPDGEWTFADYEEWQDSVVGRFRDQERLLASWRSARQAADTAQKMLEEGGPEPAERYRFEVERNRDAAAMTEELLRQSRKIMRQRGLDPGALPPELAHVDAPQDGPLPSWRWPWTGAEG